MGGFKHTGLAAGTTAGDSVRYEQLPSGSNVLAEGSGGTGTTVGHNGFKNRIINGAMMIDQRNAGASVTPTVTNTYTLDRWVAQLSAASKYSVQQSSTAPAGFINSMLVTSLAATSVGSTDYYAMRQMVEGLNVSDFAWGTASAAPITISFWVRSSLTGTFGGVVSNNAENRCYPFTYTISAANTWEQKSITIAGDQSGTWLTTNGIGLRLIFGLGVGSTYSGTAGAWSSSLYLTATGATSVVGTSGATFYITGVQLEKGSTATSFDYRPYGTELALCQRYYEVATSIDLSGYVQAGKQTYSGYTIYPKRTSATVAVGSYSNQDNCSSISTSGNDGMHVNFYIQATNGGANYARITSNTVSFSAEL
jgi:hypothetical protein